MIRRILFVIVLCLVAACNRQDVDTLGRIGQRLKERGDKYLADGKNAQMIKTLPLLQRPEDGLNSKPLAVPDAEKEPGQLD